MSVLVREARPNLTPRGRESRPSVREIRLLGVSPLPSPSTWEAGDRVTWSGRVYRVEEAATRRAEGTSDAPDDPRRYVHLAESGAG